MPVKPHNWDFPKRCVHLKCTYQNKGVDNLPCMRDECPLEKWVKPHRTGADPKTGKFLYERGKCALDV